MAGIVILVGVVNFQAHGVRAETFGQKSILYSMVNTDDSQTVEVVQAGKVTLTTGGTSYFNDTTVDERSHVDFDSFDQTEMDLWTEPAKNIPSRNGVETYIVKEGDTLGSISQRFGLSVSTILWSNNLSLRSTIRPKDELIILPQDGVMYKVKNGDTLTKIAKTYNVDIAKIVSANNLSDNSSLKIGSQLLLPGGEPPTTSTSQIARKQVSVKDIFANAPPSSSRATSTTGWVWPTNMHVITQYFTWKHSGLDVDADYSTFSIASRDGVVIYSGWRNGYGLTVEIDHGDGVITRYAHNSKLFVKNGESVFAGQKIAQSGSTGRSTGTHLHFEVIDHGVKKNPLLYIR